MKTNYPDKCSIMSTYVLFRDINTDLIRARVTGVHRYENGALSGKHGLVYEAAMTGGHADVLSRRRVFHAAGAAPTLACFKIFHAWRHRQDAIN